MLFLCSLVSVVAALRLPPLSPRWIYQRLPVHATSHLLHSSFDHATVALLIANPRMPLTSHYLMGCSQLDPIEASRRIPVNLWPQLLSIECLLQSRLVIDQRIVDYHPQSLLPLINDHSQVNLSLCRLILEQALERNQVDLDGSWWLLHLAHSPADLFNSYGAGMVSLIWPDGAGNLSQEGDPVKAASLIRWLINDWIPDFTPSNTHKVQRQVCRRVYLVWLISEQLGRGRRRSKKLITEFLKQVRDHLAAEQYPSHTPLALLKQTLYHGSDDQMLSAIWDAKEQHSGENSHWAILWHLFNPRGFLSATAHNPKRIWQMDWYQLLEFDSLPREWEQFHPHWTLEWASNQNVLSTRRQHLVHSLPFRLRLYWLRRLLAAMEATREPQTQEDSIAHALRRFTLNYDLTLPSQGHAMICGHFLQSLRDDQLLDQEGNLTLLSYPQLKSLVGCMAVTVLLDLPPWSHPFSIAQLRVLLGWQHETGWYTTPPMESALEVFDRRQEASPDELVEITMREISLEGLDLLRIEYAQFAWRSLLPRHHLLTFPEVLSLLFLP